MAGNDVIYRFLDKGTIYSIPARDLTQADYDRLTLEQQRDVRSGKLYKAATKSESKSGDTKAGNGKKGGDS